MKGNHGSRHDRDREVIKRLYFAGIPVVDIASALGTTHGSLRMYINMRGLVAERQKHYVSLINEAASEMRKGKAMTSSEPAASREDA